MDAAEQRVLFAESGTGGEPIVEGRRQRRPSEKAEKAAEVKEAEETDARRRRRGQEVNGSAGAPLGCCGMGAPLGSEEGFGASPEVKNGPAPVPQLAQPEEERVPKYVPYVCLACPIQSGGASGEALTTSTTCSPAGEGSGRGGSGSGGKPLLVLPGLHEHPLVWAPNPDHACDVGGPGCEEDAVYR